MMRGLPIILLIALIAPLPASSTRLAKYGTLRCSACSALVQKLVEKRTKLIAKEKAPVQISHRLGNGKWDPHASGGVKKMPYENSELMAIEVIEGVCDGWSDWKLRERDGKRLFSRNSADNDAEYYSKADRDALSDSGKLLKETCGEFIEEYDEELHNLLREVGGEAKKLEKEFCERMTKVCTMTYLRPFVKKEKEAREKWQIRQQKKWRTQRDEGLSDSFQLADIHFRDDETHIPISSGKAECEGTSPYNEGPEKVLDNTTSTKWLNSGKKPLHITLPSPISPTHFTFTTANDHPERDPVRWRLEASESGEGGWVSVHVQLEPYPTPFERKVTLPWFNLSVTGTAFKSFRFTMIAKKEKEEEEEKKGEEDAKSDDTKEGEKSGEAKEEKVGEGEKAAPESVEKEKGAGKSDAEL